MHKCEAALVISAPLPSPTPLPFLVVPILSLISPSSASMSLCVCEGGGHCVFQCFQQHGQGRLQEPGCFPRDHSTEEHVTPFTSNH